MGLPSLIAAQLGASDVVITDGNEEVLRLADENIRVNVPSSQQSRISTRQLRWHTGDEGALLASRDGKPFDFVIAADVTYLLRNLPDLFASIAQLCGPQTTAYVSMEPRNVGEIDAVLKTADAVGLQATEEPLSINREKDLCGMSCARMFSFRLKGATSMVSSAISSQ